MIYPEKGEVRVAADLMNERMKAVSDEVTGHDTFDMATVNVNRASGEMDGDNLLPVGGVYGDLFDVGEMVAVSADLCMMFITDIATGRRDPMSAMISVYLQAAGLGVLIERARHRS